MCVLGFHVDGDKDPEGSGIATLVFASGPDKR